MADETQAATAEAGKAAGKKAGGEKKGEQRQRSNYITMRLAEIPQRVKDYAGEREQLTASLKAKPDEKTDEVKKLRLRREYLATRIAQLREEQAALNVERKLAVSAKGKGAKAPVAS